MLLIFTYHRTGRIPPENNKVSKKAEAQYRNSCFKLPGKCIRVSSKSKCEEYTYYKTYLPSISMFSPTLMFIHVSHPVLFLLNLVLP